jgi:pimeloyl-ACP methyl ester carboxylesterase
MRETALALGSFRGVKAQWRRELADAVVRTPRPTLIVWGARDRIVPARHVIEAKRIYPHAEVHLLPGAGHMPQIECPDTFADILLPFLARGHDTPT